MHVDKKVPTFGYDANSDAAAAIPKAGGTISQHADVQAYLTLRVLRNCLTVLILIQVSGTKDEVETSLRRMFMNIADERSMH